MSAQSLRRPRTPAPCSLRAAIADELRDELLEVPVVERLWISMPADVLDDLICAHCGQVTECERSDQGGPVESGGAGHQGSMAARDGFGDDHGDLNDELDLLWLESVIGDWTAHDEALEGELCGLDLGGTEDQDIDLG